jgi:ribonuclease Z
VNEFDEKKEFSDKNLSVKPVIALPQLPGQKRTFEKIDEEEEEVTVEKETGSSSKRLVGKEADNYRQQVIASMFSDKSSNNKSATAINANCTPRHPLKNNKKGGNDNQINYLRQPLPYTRPYPAAISYICQGATLPRKFNKDAALALGVRPGPLYGQLHKGQSVTLEDGRVVTQDMVCDPPKPGHVFMLIDCPSVAYIDQLIGSEKFKEFQTGGSQQANVILHFLGNDVIHDERYKQWVASFGENTDVTRYKCFFFFSLANLTCDCSIFLVHKNFVDKMFNSHHMLYVKSNYPN